MHLFLAKTTGISSNHQSTTNYKNKWKHIVSISTKIWPSTSQTTTTNQNFTKQSGAATILPQNKNLTDIKFTEEEIELLNYGLQYNIERPLTTYFTNLIIEMEGAIKLLDTKLQNSYRIIAANKLKQILNSGNHYNILQKRRLYITKQLNKKLLTENAILVQTNKSNTFVIIKSQAYFKEYIHF